MAISTRSFKLELYREHLEEAAFLYTQRQALLTDAEIPWLRLKDFEARLEAHLDALVIGDQLALEVCRARMVEGDADELYGVVNVFCRHQDASLLGEVWASLDYADAAKVQAVTTALQQALPQTWHTACEQAIIRGDARLLPILSAVCMYRALDFSEHIAQRLLQQPECVTATIIWALAHLPLAPNAQQLLHQCNLHADHEIKANALIGLLRAGDRSALQPCYLLAQSESWPQLALGLAGDRAAVTVLCQCITAGRATTETVLALGLLGDPTTVEVLCACLKDEILAAAAAQSLFWITGAPLWVDQFISETVDEAILTPTELTAWRERGEAPKRTDGQVFGTTVQQLTRDPLLWEQWLTRHANQFAAASRYRCGKLYSPRVLLDCIQAETTPCTLRQLAYEELVIRYGCPLLFTATAWVCEQQQQLQALAAWVTTMENRHIPNLYNNEIMPA